jgi:membrane protein DedA with SNARE-associated domain
MALLEKYGGPAVFLGRFIAFARAIIPGLAGMSGLRYRTFLFWNLLGGIVWGVGYTLLGYVVGRSFQRILTQIGLWSVGVVGVLVVGVVVFEVRRRRRDHRRIEGDLAVLDGGDPAGRTGGMPDATDGTDTAPPSPDAGA